MCGIAGYKILDSSFEDRSGELNEAVKTLHLRGPDSEGTFIGSGVGLGQTRLSIIDTSELGNQPMLDPTERYILIFNGEIYNYLELKADLGHVHLKSTCDTEVLLHLLIKEGSRCLEKLNGFFALAFYDKLEDTLLIARDRMGIKPLLFYQDDNQLIFASEMKALLSFSIPRAINQDTLYWYLKLNYIPGQLSMIAGVRRLEPGQFLLVTKGDVKHEAFWKINAENDVSSDYERSKRQLVDMLEKSVQKRLMADVPLGAFLSGGTDSSAVVAMASKHYKNLSTFSVGYKDHSFFDETYYAELVAKRFNTNHTTFSLTNDDLLSDLGDILDYIDEPFADSSAIPTYILSKHVSKHIKVALSGDGADELFGGYYKHRALNSALHPSIPDHLVKYLNPLFKVLPQSRSGSLTNLFRRLDKHGRMLKMDPAERYWFLASLTNDPSSLLIRSIDQAAIDSLKAHYLPQDPSFNDYLRTDLKVLLPGDMLAKVDLMSMANSLEVRVPFLDKALVAFANKLPTKLKVYGAQRKRILQDAFRDILPDELYHRPKKGFEVPLLHWMRNELLGELDAVLFDQDYLIYQDIFKVDEVSELRKKLLSRDPGDVHGVIWALYVFQKWHRNYMDQ